MTWQLFMIPFLLLVIHVITVYSSRTSLQQHSISHANSNVQHHVDACSKYRGASRSICRFTHTWATAAHKPQVHLHHLPMQHQTAYRQHVARGSSSRNPVIFIPPLLGDQLELKVNSWFPGRHWWCWHASRSWSRLWLNAWYLFPGQFKCFAEYARVEFDATTGRSSQPPGWDVRPRPGFESAMALMSGNRTAVYAGLADSLRQLGWVEGEDLLAHLYDWRLSPTDWAAPGGAFETLQQQVDAAVATTGHKAVVVCLSMGCPYFSAFLESRQATAGWAEGHIERFVTLSGIWGGAPVAALGLVSGIWGDVDKLFRSQEWLDLLRHLPSLSWLLPSEAVYPNQTIVASSQLQRSFTPDQLGDLLRLAGATQAADVWQTARKFPAVSAPGVPTVCLHGAQVPTANFASYSTPDFSGNPMIKYADGDGTVPLASISWCGRWAKEQEAPVVERVFPGLVHAEILAHEDAFVAVLDAIVGRGMGGVS